MTVWRPSPVGVFQTIMKIIALDLLTSLEQTGAHAVSWRKLRWQSSDSTLKMLFLMANKVVQNGGHKLLIAVMTLASIGIATTVRSANHLGRFRVAAASPNLQDRTPLLRYVISTIDQQHL